MVPGLTIAERLQRVEMQRKLMAEVGQYEREIAKSTAEAQEGKEEKKERVETETKRAATSTSSTSSMPGASELHTTQSSVKPLMVLAAEELIKTVDEKKLSGAVEELARIWYCWSPADSLGTLFDQSKKIIDDLFPALKGKQVSDEISHIIYAPLIRLLLGHSFIGTKMRANVVPLFASIGRWSIDKESGPGFIFDKHGYVAALTQSDLHIFNCKSRKHKTVHNPCPAGWYDIGKPMNLFFSYDGLVVAIERRSKNLTLVGTSLEESEYPLPLLELGSNQPTHLQMSATAPLCMYEIFKRDHPCVGVLYNYKEKSYETYCVGSEKPSDGHQGPSHDCIAWAPRVSPRGTFNIYCFDRSTGQFESRVARYDYYLQHNKTKQWYLLKKNAKEGLSEGKFVFNGNDSILAMKYKSTVALFKLDELPLITDEQEPYFIIGEVPERNRVMVLSKDGTRLFVQTDWSLGVVYNILTKEKERLCKGSGISNFEAAAFLSPTLLVIQSGRFPYYKATLYDVAHSDKEIEIGYPYVFCDKTMKIAYIKDEMYVLGKGDTAYLKLLDLKTGIISTIHKKDLGFPDSDSFRHSHELAFGFDDEGSLFYADSDAIYQLMVDPTSCTLDQLFFLLALSSAMTNETHKADLCAQLYASGILKTFPPRAREHLTQMLKSYFMASGAPASFSTPSPMSSSLSSSSSSSLLR